MKCGPGGPAKAAPVSFGSSPPGHNDAPGAQLGRRARASRDCGAQCVRCPNSAAFFASDWLDWSRSRKLTKPVQIRLPLTVQPADLPQLPPAISSHTHFSPLSSTKRPHLPILNKSNLSLGPSPLCLSLSHPWHTQPNTGRRYSLNQLKNTFSTPPQSSKKAGPTENTSKALIGNPLLPTIKQIN